ncbi:MAG TPA: hypothetical protein VMS04_15285 [Vicinamibacterales bacterium]|nr:hypothetical protein [Vicinamibacterales bacterium]
MAMRSLALFAHVLGMLALFVALTVEWIAVALLRTGDRARPSSFAVDLLRQLPRLTGIAVALILASGLAMAAQFGVLRSAWVGVSFAAMVLMGGMGGASLRRLIRGIGSVRDSDDTWRREVSKPFLHLSLRARIGVALGIVYLMITKPDVLGSIATVTAALMLGTTAGVVAARVRVHSRSADEDGQPAVRATGGSRWS